MTINVFLFGGEAVSEPDTANSILGHGFPSNTEDYDLDRGYLSPLFKKKYIYICIYVKIHVVPSADSVPCPCQV